MAPDFRANCYSGNSANEVWRQAARDFGTDGPWHTVSPRGKETRELLHCTFAIERPRRRWVYSRRPALNPAAYLAEVVWILGGRNDSDPVNFFVPNYPDYAGEGPRYHGAYGYRLRHHFGLDQLERAYAALSSSPDTRQVVLQIWDPPSDFPTDEGDPRADDIPCNVLSLVKVRAGQLEWAQIIRSNDLYRGLPVNFVQFTVLQEVLAGWLDLELGEYVQLSDSLHLYKSEYHIVDKIDSVEYSGTSPASFALRKDESDRAIELLNDYMDWLVEESPSCDELSRKIETVELTGAFQDVALLMSADVAMRRNGNPAVSSRFADRCSDPRHSLLWKRWLRRLSSSDRTYL